MKQLELIIENQTGLHARPAQVLVKLAKQFKADIRIQYNQKRANCKSMVSVLTLGAGCGSHVSIETDGEDEDLALARIAEAIRARLGDVDEAAAADKTVSEAGAAASLRDESAQPEASGSIRGIGAAPGIASGPVFQFQPDDLTRVDLNLLTGGTALGLTEALAEARHQLSDLRRQMIEKNLRAEAAIFEAQAELLEDSDLIESAEARIRSGQNSAKAWQSAIEERATAIAALDDICLAARADDLRDAGGRVLRLLLGIGEKCISLPETPVVILARELSPSAMAGFDAGQVLGFVTVQGGPTSHVAILARALGLPAIVGVNESVLALADQTTVLVNGNDGTLIVDPSPEQLEVSVRARNLWQESRRRAQQDAHRPAVTRDGRRVRVTANAGSPGDAAT
ncbi:MAG: HPr family phosphocarrier protein, partial [Terracidiphilus sp.]